jgi:hypothetical protein
MYMYVSLYVCIQFVCTHEEMFVYVYLSAVAIKQVDISTLIAGILYVFVYVYVYMCMYIYIHIYI